MQSVADLVEPNIIEELAQPANFRLGSRLYDADVVSLQSFTPHEVTASIKPSTGTNRMTSLRSDGRRLSWKCSCTSDDSNFCKHMVATALATWHRSQETLR